MGPSVRSRPVPPCSLFHLVSLGYDGDFVLSEAIAIPLICHDVSPFSIDAFRNLPKRKSPARIDRLGLVVVCGVLQRPHTSCRYVENLSSFLFPGFGLRILNDCQKDSLRLTVVVWFDESLGTVRKLCYSSFVFPIS
jgi:hypothetical protein